ncbi:hypothetical protein BDK51DRAFT_38902 [Blyttiomyces helicus]|uniref:NADAR domain-containing protein n=1 Tax=Blyttiomyces helicus TaxID=388810 RepID=A0A4V1IQC4_9FUNG|nr:hypothetical protein BDK51DRAFT_38902 [Blyttiomyces helicus]|eukprot:RKO86067.1 hypothetical protein BDK51DRAFT_38902 [Blyttiomyces helicus]
MNIRKTSQGKVFERFTSNVLLFAGPHSPFDNWHPTTIRIGRTEFPTSEHAIFLFGKAMAFGDVASARKALGRDVRPQDAKRLGRLVSPFDPAEWDRISPSLSDFVLFHKFAQDDTMKQYLLATDDAIIAESVAYDRIWGTGVAIDAPGALQANSWPGKNGLGQSLMRVRSILHGAARGDSAGGEHRAKIASWFDHQF